MEDATELCSVPASKAKFGKPESLSGRKLLLSELQALETFACFLPDAVIEEIPASKSAVAKRTSASRAKRRGFLFLGPSPEVRVARPPQTKT